DTVISQGNKSYLDNLINYNKILSQRNALLKYFALNNTFNSQTLQVYNEQLQTYGTEIFKTRYEFLETFIPIFKLRYNAISNHNEEVNLSYKSDLFDGELVALLKENINKDKALQYTSVGIHKDDLNFEIDTFPIKKFGSQG
ncbi:MAG: DNA replication/repair protein RecF, partial [Gelidibacter sp.]|nr:DNA replication/repair protein RecF [Gelidibacter sp.]